MKTTLVQMHAPSLEAVNPITLFSPAASCQLPLPLNPSVRADPFVSPAAILSAEHGRTSTRRGWRWTRNRRSASLISARGLGGGLTRSHLLSSPPALTTKRSPFVKRVLVRWAEWPRKRLCLAWNRRRSSESTMWLSPVIGLGWVIAQTEM